ncbi:hypothetical protein F4778DRAFT_671871 [Xylariomycetidae sp. FL2044]|nr:hypothetical protein F4778DRAFT_671871 [Xylariomycetidae sp. FL2044]
MGILRIPAALVGYCSRCAMKLLTTIIIPNLPPALERRCILFAPRELRITTVIFNILYAIHDWYRGEPIQRNEPRLEEAVGELRYREYRQLAQRLVDLDILGIPLSCPLAIGPPSMLRDYFRMFAHEEHMAIENKKGVLDFLDDIRYMMTYVDAVADQAGLQRPSNGKTCASWDGLVLPQLGDSEDSAYLEVADIVEALWRELHKGHRVEAVPRVHTYYLAYCVYASRLRKSLGEGLVKIVVWADKNNGLLRTRG